MGVFNLFGKGQEFDPKRYEKELTSIVENITITNQQISGLTTRDKSIKRLLIQYSIILYVLVLAYNYTSIPHNTVGRNIIERFVRGQTRNQLLVAVLFPGISVVFVKLIHYCFQVLINGRTRRLESLRKKHKDKIEELKKISNFNTTSELINKYDKPASPQVQPQPQPQQMQQQPQSLNNGQSQQAQLKENISPLERQALKELNLKQPAPPVVLDQLQPAKRTLQDRLLDILIGSENNESIEKRYALICYNCYTHNGLAPPNTTDPLSVKYCCWKCGVMNGKDMILLEMNKLDNQVNKSVETNKDESGEEEQREEIPGNVDNETAKTSTTPEAVEEKSEKVADTK
ncbi:hypothetical protein JA1_001917 [Spathaspora sp. JA1]|nr:hypothetical protein JA1_001917 [Spathaspora sp. JA1]